jgi:hypothetical protein
MTVGYLANFLEQRLEYLIDKLHEEYILGALLASREHFEQLTPDTYIFHILHAPRQTRETVLFRFQEGQEPFAELGLQGDVETVRIAQWSCEDVIAYIPIPLAEILCVHHLQMP